MDEPRTEGGEEENAKNDFEVKTVNEKDENRKQKEKENEENGKKKEKENKEDNGNGTNVSN